MTDSEKLEIDISDDTAKLLLTQYVEKHLYPESLETFNECLDNDCTIADATIAGIINDCIIDLLKEMIQQLEEPTKNDWDEFNKLLTTPCWRYCEK